MGKEKFDPEKYIAEKERQGPPFDPAKYLAAGYEIAPGNSPSFLEGLGDDLNRGTASLLPMVAGATAGMAVGGPPGAVVGSMVVPAADALATIYNYVGNKIGIPSHWQMGSTSQLFDKYLTKAGVLKPQAEVPLASSTDRQKVQSDKTMRIIQGMRDPFDAGAQIVARMVPESATNFLDIPGSALRRSKWPFLKGMGETFFADPRPSAIDKSISETEAQYQAAREATGQSGTDWARFTGNVLSPTNVAVATAIPTKLLSTSLRRIGTGTLGGGIGGALAPITGEPEQQDFASEKAKQAGLGAALGGVLTPLMSKLLSAVTPYVERFVSNIAGTSKVAGVNASLETDRILAKATEDIGQTIYDIPKPEYEALRQHVADALKKGQKLDAAAFMRQSDFKALNIPHTTGQITRNSAQFAREKNLRGVPGVGDPLLELFDAQSKALHDQLGGFAKGASKELVAGGRLLKVLAGVDEAMREQISIGYNAARKSSNSAFDVPLQGLASDAMGIYNRFTTKIPNAIRKELGSYGIFGGKQIKVFTFNEANELLKNINSHSGRGDGYDAVTNTALSELRTAVKKAMMDAPVPDVFAKVRAAAKTRFDLHDDIPALKAAAEKSVSADSFVQKFVLNAPSVQVKRMAELLKKTSPEAFQEARSQIGEAINRAAFGEDLARDKLITPERMARELRKMGPERLGAFFSKLEIDQLNRIARVAAYIVSTPGAAAVSSSSSNIASMVLNYGTKIPNVGILATVLKAVGSPVVKQNAVNRALAAKIPKAANKSPDLIHSKARLAAVLMGMGAAGGAGRAQYPQIFVDPAENISYE